jgi:large subunit ribosomal protein L24
MKIKKGDNVKILSGKERGKISTVERVFARDQKITVKEINVVKKHTKPSGRGKNGGIIEKSLPISISRVAVVCSSCNKPTRVGFVFVDGKKYRRCVKCSEVIK